MFVVMAFLTTTAPTPTLKRVLVSAPVVH